MFFINTDVIISIKQQLKFPGLKDFMHDNLNETHQSTESSNGEHWAKITERPEEEEIANIESREVTQDEIVVPRVPSPSPVSEAKSPEGQRMEELAAQSDKKSRRSSTIKEEDEEYEKEEEEDNGRAGKADTHRSRSIGLQTESEVGSQSSRAQHMPSKTPKTPGRSSEFDADDEHEDEDEEVWPSNKQDGDALEAVAEVSVEQQSSRKASLQSKLAMTKSDSKTASPSRPGSKEDPNVSQSLDQSKSHAPSVASDRKSSTQKGDKTAPPSATPSKTADSVTLSVEEANQRKSVEMGGKQSASTSKTGNKSAVSEDAKRSVSEKSKARTVTKSVEKSEPSSAAGRVSTDSKSRSKAESRSVSEKGDKSASVRGGKSVSGRSSKRSKRADSQTKNASRATTGTKLSTAKLSTPPPTADAVNDGEGEKFEDNPWDDDDDDREYGDDFDDGEGPAEEAMIDDTEEYRMPSTPSEDNARISGDEPRRKSNALDFTIEGQQLLTPPASPGIIQKKSSGELEPERGTSLPHCWVLMLHKKTFYIRWFSIRGCIHPRALTQCSIIVTALSTYAVSLNTECGDNDINVITHQ